MRPQILNLTYWEDLCWDIFDAGLDINRSVIEFAKNKVHGTNIVFTNGDEDPWRWATDEHMYIPELGQKALLADCDDCGHCADLYTPKDSDPKSLQYVRKAVYLEVSKWLKSHKEKQESNLSIEEVINYRVRDHYETMQANERAMSSEFI